MSYVPPLVIEAQSGVGMRLRINEISAKPPNWPSTMMRLQKDVWIAQIVRNVEKLVGDFLRAGKLPPGGMKQPQSDQRRRQVDGSVELSRQKFRTLKGGAHLRRRPTMYAHQSGTQLRQDRKLGLRAAWTSRLLFDERHGSAEMPNALTVVRPTNRKLPGGAPVSHSFLVELRLRAVSRQYFGLRFREFWKFFFQSRNNLAVELLPAAPQERAVRCVLDERVFEQIAGVRRNALPEQHASPGRGGRAQPPVPGSLFSATAAINPCEKSRPIAAPICAISLAAPSRSSLAISEACRVAGTGRTGDAVAAIEPAASLSSSNSTAALAISSANKGTPSARSAMSLRMLSGNARLPTTRSTNTSISFRVRRLSVSAVA